MKMHQVVEYITATLGIKSDNPYIIDDIVQELSAIDDLELFKQHLKAKITTEPYNYLNGMQRFLKAIAEYKNINSESKDEAIEKYCRKLIEKIRSVSRAVDENLPSGLRYNDFAETATFDNFKNQNGGCVFDEKEQKLLKYIGSCKVWLLTYDDNDFLLKLIRAVKNLNKVYLAPPKEKTLSLEDIKNRSK